MYRVYAVVQRPKQEDYWLNIGAAFPHEKGDGSNIILQAHPIGDKLVVRLYEPTRDDVHISRPNIKPLPIRGGSFYAHSSELLMPGREAKLSVH